MNKLFRRLPFPIKLTLIGLIPLIFLIGLSIQVYREKEQKISILNNYLQRTMQSVNITQLVDELQNERRYSFGYVVNRNWRSELVMERTRTDAAVQKLESEAGDQLKGVSKYTLIDQLPRIRAKIDDNQAEPREVMNYYTNTIFRLNSLNNLSGGNIISLQPIKAEILGQKILSEVITHLGILRANVYYALFTKQNSVQDFESLRSTYDLYKTYETEFLLKSSPASVREYREILAHTDMKPTLDYLDNIFKDEKLNNLYSPEKWWAVSASGVDNLKNLRRVLVQQVQTGVNTIYNQENKDKNRMLFFLALIIAAVVFIISYTIKIITETIYRLKQAAQKISSGITGLSFQPESDDVIGSLAMSISRIDENNRVLAEAARAIGSGDFSIAVEPRSKDDMLGNAVAKMKNDLEQFNRENKEKLWIHEGLEKVNEKVSGEKQTAVLAKDALDQLATWLDAGVGLIYVCYDNVLHYTAGYAVTGNGSMIREIRLGETLLGQAVLKNELMHLKEVPGTYIKVASATGHTQPANILMIPLVHNDVVEGVIEIASLHDFSPAELSFADQARAVIAVALQSVKSRVRLQELYEETQAQSEELQAQHKELESINSELEAQTQKLQVSEEELRVQQEELMQANQELEERTRLLEEKNQLIVERNFEIQKKAEELAISTRYKSEFLANMSHELRTPLNSILLLSRLLSENKEKSLTAEQVEYAEVIQSSGKGLLSLIDEILDLSKIEAGKMELEFDQVSVKEVVNDMNSLFKTVAREKKLQFSVHIDEDTPRFIETDKMRLEQVLKNLLSNALKFTAKGSVSLQVNTLPGNSSFIAFSVKDTGIGIPDDKQQLVFEVFQQADGSTRRKFGGTGLGLSISRELTKLLGGEIKVSSEPGKGSEFIVYIPVKQEEPGTDLPAAKDEVVETEGQESAGRAEAGKENGKPGHTVSLIPESVPDDRQIIGPDDKVILIVEDDTPFARALLEFTHSKGYKGLIAVRGDEGVAMAQKYKPSGILLDIQLPVKDGWQVMDELKANPHTRHIPVHIMSSLQEAKKRSLLKGAVDFITKPLADVQLQEVFKKLEKVLSGESKKVLIVEENPKHAKALAYFLETFHVSSEISNNIPDGVKALKRDDVDCVIMDMGIPDEKAYEALEEVKKSPGLENLPVIIFTGKSLSKSEESKIRQYADSIVVKTAHSYQRVLDEVSLFLHLVEEGSTVKKAHSKYQRLGELNEVLAGKKILVADDDVRNIFSLTKSLEAHDMKVLTAMDGKEALRILEENPDTDVVLMDIMMPEMDGYEAIRNIRQQLRYRDLPVIAVTAKAMTGDREKCIKAGASDYISKPVDTDQLMSLLRVWLYE